MLSTQPLLMFNVVSIHINFIGCENRIRKEETTKIFVRERNEKLPLMNEQMKLINGNLSTTASNQLMSKSISFCAPLLLDTLPNRNAYQ